MNLPIPFAIVAACLIGGLSVLSSAAAADDASKAVSFTADVLPVFNRSCVACHKPGKSKGKLDLTSYGGLSAGGESGPAFVAGKPVESSLVQQITGPEPEMPAKGEPLAAAEVDLIRRWIEQGGRDDTPAAAASVAVAEGYAPPGPPPPDEPPVYAASPVITAVAYSPDGQFLAVGGRHEILLHKADGSELMVRIPSGSPRTNSLVFSDDAKRLVAAGGAPGRFGQVQVWSMPDGKPVHNYKVSDDTLFGLSLSPTGDRAAVGCADRTVRVIQLADGKELARLDPHTDWVFGAAFSADGGRVVSGGRDKALQLTDLSSSHLSEGINDPKDPIQCLARHPTEDLVLAGAANGALRLYRTTDLKPRTEQARDPNQVKEVERQPGPVNAVAFARDGARFAVASVGEARVYSKDGNRKATLPGHAGAVFSVAFSPDGKHVCTGGYDGQVRVFEAEKGQLIKSFVPVPVGGPAHKEN